MATLFSITTANYNNGRYLPALIKSMQAQTYTSWELLIADDASTDDSLAIIASYSKDDKRIKVVRHSLNKGAGAAFKSAVDIARGEIIGLLGADDALLPSALEKMYNAHLQYPDASMINSQAYDCDSELRPQGVCAISGCQPPGKSLIDEVHVANFVTFKTDAYKRTSGFDPSFQRAVDHDIFLKLEEVGSLAFVEEPLYLYRRHELGISQGSNGMNAANFSLKARINAYNRRRSTGFLPNLSEAEYREISRVYLQRISNQLRLERKFSDALKACFQCVRISPSYLLNLHFWAALFYNSKGIISGKGG